MIVLGLTGSIGMGKSMAARLLRGMGVPVHDADAQVHRLLGPGGAAVKPVAAAFPGVLLPGGGIDRQALGRIVFADDAALRRLEAIIHPMVRRSERRFLAVHRGRRSRLVVLDIPLLYETGAQARCDAVAVVSVPPYLQRRRVLARPGMTPAKFAGILAKQVPDRLKRARADFLVPGGPSVAVTRRALACIVADLRCRAALGSAE